MSPVPSEHRQDWLPTEAHEIIKVARQKAKLTTPNMPQHVACLDVIEEGILEGGYPGVLKVCLVEFLLSQNNSIRS